MSIYQSTSPDISTISITCPGDSLSVAGLKPVPPYLIVQHSMLLNCNIYDVLQLFYTMFKVRLSFNKRVPLNIPGVDESNTHITILLDILENKDIKEDIIILKLSGNVQKEFLELFEVAITNVIHINKYGKHIL